MVRLKRSDLIQWLDRNAGTRNIIAPQLIDDVLLYRKLDESSQVVWNFTRPALSIKGAFFPPTERLFTIEKTAGNVKLTEVDINQVTILFGIRPCDARGIAVLDALFIGTEPVDSTYMRRRRRSAIIGLECLEMGDTCFCTSTGGAPDDPTGMDILLKEANGDFIAQAVTDLGLRFALEEWGLNITGTINPETSHDLNELPDPEFNIPEIKSWPPVFEEMYWDDIAERCISCRICAYVCPTCRCFDVRDESISLSRGRHPAGPPAIPIHEDWDLAASSFERIRCWDSCAGENYRSIAGGHNPRSEKGQRLRNRFFCKFYYFPEQVGPIACTGCGRCIESCPVGIDITEVISHIADQTSQIDQPLEVQGIE